MNLYGKASQAGHSENPNSARRPTVAVVGLRYGQPSTVQTACGHLVFLKFVDASRSATRLPDADLVILLTRFIQHRWSEAAFRCFPRQSVVLHPGGVSSLVRRIALLATTGAV